MCAHRILITPTFLREGDIVDRLLRDNGCEPLYRPANRSRTPAEMADLVGDVDAAIVAGDRVTGAVLDAAPRLRVVARPGVGYDAIDVDAATARGVVVCNLPGVNDAAVAELTIGLLLMCARNIPQRLAEVRAGKWERIAGRELRGATLGLVGLGTIGRSVAALAKGFGMAILAHDRYQDRALAESLGISYVGLDELLARSDYVSLHTPLDESTRHLIDRDRLRSMKASAFLVNASRGPVVSEADLCEALREGRLAGAALDVTETEPLPADSPLRELDNVYVTPHIGGVTREARQRSAKGAALNVMSVLRGERPAGTVNPGVFDLER